MIRKIMLVALEATLYFLLGVLACVLHHGLADRGATEFAGRWDGSCAGWTRPLATANVAGNLLLWWAYSAISITVLRLHPVVENVRESRWSIRFIGAFVIACGGTHLLEAYASFRPSIYPFATYFTIVTAVISDISIFFVAAGLIRVFARVMKARARLAEFEAREAR